MAKLLSFLILCILIQTTKLNNCTHKKQLVRKQNCIKFENEVYEMLCSFQRVYLLL